MRPIFLFLIPLIFSISCSSYSHVDTQMAGHQIDAWHQAAANAEFDTYFDLMTSDAIFIGTDATENWSLKEFKTFSKPYFDRGKAWSFESLERNMYQKNALVYFDELLDTQMGICRGSGVMAQEDGRWKIAHYVLSIAVPNENVASLTELKKEWDTDYINQLRNQ
ncbi:nuclear transport factor 2 family protein [Nonlabens xiamenensis]|uniref:nuclear transport factor 2 family protein n=1 Tax=Nonlabens xiamenensis TaxID=2341043 RepID=UPI000F607BBB|nr:nuclear transport factor 2 family protein [Nonlabens xiamenensis]